MHANTPAFPLISASHW
uniref:Uncharacterized protein n=1 Tax=Arundo donax TaxID=35708 RepID=A0A0A9GQQ4_ARUDO